MYEAIFNAESVEGSLVHEDTSTTSGLDVIVRRDVLEVDEYDSVVHRRTEAHFKVSQIVPKQKEELIIPEGVHAGVYRIGKEIRNNAYVIAVEVVKKSDYTTP